MLDMAGDPNGRKEKATPKIYTELEAWFNNRVFRGQNKPFAEIVEITPAVAELFLRNNPGNRAFSPTNLDRLTNEIVNGRWEMNGETIIVANDGSLNDGQHRCRAVIETQTPILSLVMFGAARHSRYTTDQGIVRTVGDMATMDGIENGTAVAAAAGYVWSYNAYGVISHGRSGIGMERRPTRTQILEVINTHKEVIEDVKQTKMNFPGGRPLGAFCRWAFERRSGDKAKETVNDFFDRMASGADLAPRHPILIARNMLLQRDARRFPNEKAQIIFSAWNSIRANELSKKYFMLPKDPRALLQDLRR